MDGVADHLVDSLRPNELPLSPKSTDSEACERPLPLVSIVVLNFNGASHLPECLESLVGQDYPEIEIIVADNGSTDNSRDIVARYEGIVFADLQGNHGFGKGNNLGAQQAHGKYLFFVNNDMRFAPEVVSRLVSVAEADENVFALDIKQYSWDSSHVIHSALRLRMTIDPRAPFMPFIGYEQVDSHGIERVPFANGANLFCRRSMFQTLGGFDPTFFIDHEDQDLCWRACMRGWKVLYLPDVVCWHKVGQAWQGSASPTGWTPWRKRRFESAARNRIRFIMKTQGWIANLLTLVTTHLLALVYLVAGKRYQSRVMAWSYWTNVMELPQLLRHRRDAHSACYRPSWRLIRDFLSQSGG